MSDKIEDILGKLPVIGMVHLAGWPNIVERAIEEVSLYDKEGFAGAIVENYHTSSKDMVETVMEELSKLKLRIKLGVNILPNEFLYAFEIAENHGGSFIQVDYISGIYNKNRCLDVLSYNNARKRNPNIAVIGGVWPKYYTPNEGSILEEDLKVGSERCEAIAVTGSGTGKVTPMDKIRRFKETLPNTPIYVAAGVTPENLHEQLMLADGVIVGSSLKPDGNTEKPVNKDLVRDFMKQYKTTLTSRYGPQV